MHVAPGHAPSRLGVKEVLARINERLKSTKPHVDLGHPVGDQSGRRDDDMRPSRDRSCPAKQLSRS